MFRRKRKPSDFGAEIEAHLQLETERLREEDLLGALVQSCPSPVFLEYRRIRSVRGCGNWEFAWPLAQSGRKC